MAKRGGKKNGREPCLVLDCSVVLAWFFSDESNAYADQVANSLQAATALVPAIWPLEVANTLVLGERRQRCTAAQASAFLSRLASLPVRVVEQTRQLAWSTIYSLARAQQLSVYDATYVELALREGLPLATLDSRLSTVGAGLGIARFAP